MTDLFSNIDVMEKLLDVKLKRYELISNNLANVDTPGYKRMGMSFEEILMNSLNQRTIPLAATNDKHIDPRKKLEDIKPKIYRQEDYSFRNDENNVDIDKEMVEMIKNNFSYNIISDQIITNLKILQTAISEGGK
ncbi:Flagellar basal body rod protein FlgB [Tepidanaerobacter acetatoxydans Re1]|uniref:Flagellar basal body rod protein FlgB n=1 Tax=Tepidanaerobacter acetatoxydans (strain DSM 21804 / JCM 16047 / Re1) TaxID=1209989 RepID=F4LTN2_TEPAE|nr:flagellar basal body rod protein FlgB [Tepidanaerobacter acetatoxydans]AEE91362.1 flagellar basal-body rod protein FlgB [Tepidanaerobacter acetatoxydans Re1]CCP26056.1 Flagellar basal body rod protein FlgB [Tepidanaerobacter acetatoxydans Re1]